MGRYAHSRHHETPSFRDVRRGKPALLPLPLELFRYYRCGTRTVHLDGSVEVEAAYYSAPLNWAGRKVQVQWDGRFVRLLDPATGQLLREHIRHSRGRHLIHDKDRSKRTLLSTEQLLARSRKAGLSIGTSYQGEEPSGAGHWLGGDSARP